MRLMQKAALLLTGVMLAGVVGVTYSTEAKAADPTYTFTLNVPSEASIKVAGWNDIGNIGVSDVSIQAGNSIDVTIDNGATGRTLKKSEGSETIGYVIKKGTRTSSEDFGTVNFVASGTVAIGAVVDDFSSKAEGTYEDTIDFTATLKDQQPVTMRTTSTVRTNRTLTTNDLGTPDEWTYNGKKYYVYNDFVKHTGVSNANDAKEFPNLLNAANSGQGFDGHRGWMTLNSIDMARKWIEEFKSKDFGVIKELWVPGVRPLDSKDPTKRTYIITTSGSDFGRYTTQGFEDNGFVLLFEAPAN